MAKNRTNEFKPVQAGIRETLVDLPDITRVELLKETKEPKRRLDGQVKTRANSYRKTERKDKPKLKSVVRTRRQSLQRKSKKPKRKLT